MNERDYYVYALLSEDATPFYIGASQDKNRYDSHVYGKNPVIAEMRSRGVKPVLKIIKKRLSRIEALSMERDIIAGIGLDRLTNGNGGIDKITVSKDEWLRDGKCRDARALLNWSMMDLAKNADTDLWTIVDFEITGRKIQPETVPKLVGVTLVNRARGPWPNAKLAKEAAKIGLLLSQSLKISPLLPPSDCP